MLRYVSVLSTLLLAGSAHAALVTIEYSSTISALDFEEYLGGPDGLVDHVDIGGFTISKGETIKGRLTYDDATPLTAGSISDFSYYWADNVANYTITFEGSGTEIVLTNTRVSTSRYGRYDQFDFGGVAGVQGSASPYFSSGLSLRGANGIHDPATLPGAADLPAYNDQSPYGDDQQLWINIGASYIWVFPTRFTVQVISSVPEPTTYGMLAAGLGLIGLAARRRKSSAP